MADKVTVANIPLSDYGVRSTIATDGSNIQHVRLDVGSGTDEQLVSSSVSIPSALADICLAIRNLFQAISRPIWYSVATNNLRVQTDTNSTLLTYQYYIYPAATTQGATSVWSQEGTDGYSLHRTCWATNVRSCIR